MARQDVLPYLQQAGAAYGTNWKVLDNIARRESTYNTGVVNDWDSNARAGTPSAGLMQFIKPTFDAFARQAREANPAAWAGVKVDWMNPQAQALAASWAIANGKGGHWATFKDALRDAGVKSAKGAQQPRSAPQQPRMQPQQSYGLQAAGPLVSASLLDDGSFLKGYLNSRANDPGPTIQTPAAAPRAAKAPSAPTKGGVPPRRPGETGQQYLDRVLMAKFGLKHDPGNSQTTGGRHTANSYHYRGGGQATDFGNARNTEAQLAAAKRYVDANAAALGIAESLDEGDHMHFATLRSTRGLNKRGI